MYCRSFGTVVANFSSFHSRRLRRRLLIQLVAVDTLQLFTPGIERNVEID